MLHYSRLLWATLPLTLAALGAAQPVRAQTEARTPGTAGQTPTPAPTPGTADPDADAAGDIVIAGSYARSLAAATETKR